jgi:hypothetical protein
MREYGLKSSKWKTKIPPVCNSQNQAGKKHLAWLNLEVATLLHDAIPQFNGLMIAVRLNYIYYTK